MNKIKSYKNFINESTTFRTRDEAELWVKTKLFSWNQLFNPDNFFKVNDDLSITVFEDIQIQDKSLKTIPTQLHIKTSGSFHCENNYLSSLIGCPSKNVTTFDCSNNHLTSLQYSPKEVDEVFNCSDNKSLYTLRYCPQKIKNDFDFASCNIVSLIYLPEYVGGYIFGGANKISCVNNFPKFLRGKMNLENNPITSIDENIDVDLMKLDIDNKPSIVWPYLFKTISKNPAKFSFHRKWINQNIKSVPKDFLDEFDHLFEIEKYNSTLNDN